MAEDSLLNDGFLAQLTALIEKNISNEQFGVSELADLLNMSRSNLLRKVKKESNLSVSQLISEVRLKRAMNLLRTASLNVSEVSHQVGFNSPSYFIKCFREYYGYPPGEVGRREVNAQAEPHKLPEDPGYNKKLSWLLIATTLVIIAGFYYWTTLPKEGSDEEKSIAVLPFKNDSNDSTNLYLINGLMESTLNNLNQIQDLRVVSRTSVEKYRNTSKSIPEMAKELNVKYFVEGSGQKIGDRILLNIQLIDASTDKHLWSKQYRREAKDIFELQDEIARNITEEIEVFITPEEKNRIKKKPTDDLLAYDYFLKGRELLRRSAPGDLQESVTWFKKAIERDPKFSLAYATAAMSFYYMDIFTSVKPHTADVENFAEKSMLYDARSSESMIAKALSFAMKGQFELSTSYFEKALQYDPRSTLVLHFLTEFYNIHVPNPPKYLGYAIQRVKVDKGADSVNASHNYFHLSNALLQNGFLDEALKYNNKSLQLNPKHFFAGLINDYIYYAKDRDPAKARDRLLTRWKNDTTRFDILMEVGKMNYMTGDYAASRSCYERAVATMKMYGLDVFKPEYLRIAMAYSLVGEKEKSEVYLKEFKDYADHDLTMYKDLYLASYYFYKGEAARGNALFKSFSKQDNFLYWILLIPSDPMFKSMDTDAECTAIRKEIEKKYWKKHEEIKEKWGDELKEL